ncbi:MAG: calcium-binding protein, partial [Pseudomonadota bacterium]|nr:calcium-binding protein [Pseudomonadota bacterium]
EEVDGDLPVWRDEDYYTGGNYTYFRVDVEKLVWVTSRSFSFRDFEDSWWLPANAHNMMLLGSANLSLRGDKYDNLLIGNDGDNYLTGLGGSDILEGRGGDDSYGIAAGDIVKEIENGGTDHVRSIDSYQLPDHVENLTLSGAGSHTGAGNDLNNVIKGNDYANVLRGFGGADRLDGGRGADEMYGGYGNDKYHVQSSGDKVVEAAGAGWDTVFSSVTFTLSSNVEQLVLVGTGAIDGTGNGMGNFITGNDGANVLRGRGGADTLDGRAGPDKLFGGLGHDSLKGGAGYDGFYFDTPLDPSANVDKILAYSPYYDTIFLSRSIFSVLPTGTLAEAAFQVGSSAQDATDRIIYQKSTGSIFYDADGKGGAAAVLFAQVTPETELTHADFNVYVPG